jgi:hypothetical protein
MESWRLYLTWRMAQGLIEEAPSTDGSTKVNIQIDATYYPDGFAIQRTHRRKAGKIFSKKN